MVVQIASSKRAKITDVRALKCRYYASCECFATVGFSVDGL